MPNLKHYDIIPSGVIYPYSYDQYITFTGTGTPSPDLPKWEVVGTASTSSQPVSSDRQFIKLLESFKQKSQELEIPDGQSEYSWTEKMKISANELLEIIRPDKISLDITHDKSIFYTLIKNDITIFFEHFLVDEYDENDDAGFTAFRSQKKIANYGGTLHDSFYELGLQLKGSTSKPLMVA